MSLLVSLSKTVELATGREVTLVSPRGVPVSAGGGVDAFAWPEMEPAPAPRSHCRQ